MNKIEIQTPKGLRKIGQGEPCFIIAEMSGNHNQKIENAYKIIDAAVAAEVDAVKLQTYTPDTLTIDCDNEFFQVNVNQAWSGKSLYKLYQEAFTPWEWQKQLKAYGEERGVLVFSTPFDETAVDFLETLAMVMYKVSSFEVGDLEFLKRIGQTKKPVIVSRGLASLEDIALAIKILKEAGAPQVAVLHCISSYPATVEQMNIATVPDLAKKFEVITGLSDHSLGIIAAVSAVALGASIIEKHFILSRGEGGPDAAFSLEPEELQVMVKTIRETELAIGVPNYDVGKKEAENLVFRRSLFVVQDIKKGESFTKDNVRCIRPGYGLAPKELDKVIGQKTTQDLKRGTPLSWDLIEKN